MRKINHQAYHLPGITDKAVLVLQAERRRDDKRHPEVTIVHDHAHFQSPGGRPKKFQCTEACMIYIPGEITRSVQPKEVP
jgi:hypothetical protein